jgi:pimeloyl-ACP methyl ester carboxylesterase
MNPWSELEQYSSNVFLKESGLNLFCFDTGGTDRNLPVCILLHGLADEADTWRHIITPLSRRYRVLAPDLPGFGRSDKPRISYSIPFLSECISELMEKQHIEKCLFIGSSLGAMISQFMALEYPEKVNGLILADGLLLNQPRQMSLSLLLFLTPGLGESLYSALSLNPEKAYSTLTPYYSNLEGLSERDKNFLFERVNQRVADKGQRYAYFSLLRSLDRWLGSRQDEFRSRLKGCDVPTLLIWGGDDYIIPRENGEELLILQPFSCMKIINHAGHLPHQEKPDLFLSLVEEWLEEKE